MSNFVRVLILLSAVALGANASAQVPVELRPEDKRPEHKIRAGDHWRIPEASLPCSPDEETWWNSVRKAGDDVRRSKGGKKELKKFAELLNEGVAKSYKVPIPDRRPLALNQAYPEYTDEARSRNVSGSVSLYAEVLPDGTIGRVRVLRGLGFGLDENAITAAKKGNFLPSVKDGKFVPTFVQLEMNFAIYRYR